MKKTLVRQLLVVALALGGAFAVGSFAQRSAVAPQKDSGIALQRPAFFGVAHAETGQLSNFAEDEAGIAAYINLNQVVTLNVVDDVCRTVEASTADYFQCNVGITDYAESADVKVYVQKNGWVLAYYPKGTDTSKIFDWAHYDGGTSIPTMLEQALTRVIQKSGSTATTFTYYHFAYPNANRLMLIADKTITVNDEFQVTLPSGFSYFERSWAFRDAYTPNAYSEILLDAISLFKGTGQKDKYFTGLLSASQLAPDTVHTITIDPYLSNSNLFGGLALVYRVP